MMMNRSTRLTLAIALTGALAVITARTPAQNHESQPKQPAHRGLAVVAEDDLVLLHFNPKQQVESLAQLAFQMWGRAFVTEEGSPNVRRNIFQNANAIVIYDESPAAKRILRMVQELDAARTGNDQPIAPTDLRTTIIKVEHAAADDVRTALRPFTRNVRIRTKDGGQHNATNIEVLDARSCIIVRDDKENLAAIRDVVAKIDTPRPQVMLNCWVIQGSQNPADATADGMKVPDLLVRDLKQLVPMQSFTARGMGLLNLTVEPRGNATMSINLTDGARAELHLICRGFNEGSNILQIDQCMAQLTDPRGPGQKFTTQVSLKVGEYTVLGAMGSQPIFVVLRVERQSRNN